MLLYCLLERCILSRIVVCLLPVVLAAACVVIPIPINDLPGYEEAKSNLIVGLTIKHEVISQFGEPDAKFYDDSEYVYTELADSWKIAWAIAIPYGGGDAGVDTLQKKHVLLLSFDDRGVLSNIEADSTGDDFGDCTESGICFGIGKEMMRFADAVADAKAKEFSPSESECSVYLHGPGKENARTVRTNFGQSNYMLSTKSFMHWTLKPGQHHFTVAPKPASVTLDCQAGETYFVHVNYRRFGSSTMHLEDQDTGRKHIADRRLIILPSGRH